jgi:hypothetical protein
MGQPRISIPVPPSRHVKDAAPSRRTISVQPVTLADLIPPQYRTPGFSAVELAIAEERAGNAFPPDLSELLSASVPKGPQFPDWRADPREAIDGFRRRVIEGIQFDAIHNDVWLQSWGERPAEDEVVSVVAQLVRDAPVLIPVYGNRAIPNEPLEAGNPVFSVVQTDVIVYGSSLREYLLNEFHPRPPGGAVLRSVVVREIRFWTALTRA